MRSFLDAVDLAAVRAAAAELEGPFATVVACLRDADVLQHDPRDPTWPDRDRLLVADGDAQRAVRAAWSPPGTPGELDGGAPGTALGVAVGAAIGSALDGGIFRVWCLLGDRAVDDGAVWESARSAASSHCGLLTAVVIGESAPIEGLFAAAGWAVDGIDLDDPLEVLGAMDQATTRRDRPSVLVRRSG